MIQIVGQAAPIQTGSRRGSRLGGRFGRIVAAGALVCGLAACGGDDDDRGGDPAETEASAADAAAAEPAQQQEPADTADAADGYGLPADYPLPAPEGGTPLTVLFDDASATSNVSIAYPLDVLDDLVQTYDQFFDGVEGETARVPLTDGLASWQNDAAGYSVIVNGQNQDVQVRLQTGI